MRTAFFLLTARPEWSDISATREASSDAEFATIDAIQYRGTIVFSENVPKCECVCGDRVAPITVQHSDAEDALRYGRNVRSHRKDVFMMISGQRRLRLQTEHGRSVRSEQHLQHRTARHRV